MIRINSNIPEVLAKFTQAQKGIMRANVKSVRGATLAGQRFARRIAPVKTGALKAGIIRKPVTRKGKVVSSVLISKVEKDFPYQKWVNENIKTIRLFGKGRPRTYRSTKHTGVPGYFNLTARYMSKVFPQFAVQELNRELKIAMKK